MFKSGDAVEIVEKGTTLIRTGRVISETYDNRGRVVLDVEITSPMMGAKIMYSFVRGGGWQILHPNPGDEPFIHPDGPVYLIRKVS